MKAEVYILGLFSFAGEDEKNIVFRNDQLASINANIEAVLGIKPMLQEKSKWVIYEFNKKKMMKDSPSSSRIVEAKMGYYHHRVIFNFTLEGPDINAELRDLREELKNFALDKINNAIIAPNRLLGFEHCDIYPLLIIHEGSQINQQKENPVFSNDTTTVTFDINEPNFFLPVGKKYTIRISIPSTIIYTKKGVSDDFLKSIINSIYQYCLYGKKEIRKDQTKAHNDINEEQLVNLWKHIIDTMGGRMLDKNISKISQTNYFVAFAAFVVAVIAFDATKFSANVTSVWDFFRRLFFFIF